MNGMYSNDVCIIQTIFLGRNDKRRKDKIIWIGLIWNVCLAINLLNKISKIILIMKNNRTL